MDNNNDNKNHYWVYLCKYQAFCLQNTMLNVKQLVSRDYIWRTKSELFKGKEIGDIVSLIVVVVVFVVQWANGFTFAYRQLFSQQIAIGQWEVGMQLPRSSLSIAICELKRHNQTNTKVFNIQQTILVCSRKSHFVSCCITFVCFR